MLTVYFALKAICYQCSFLKCEDWRWRLMWRLNQALSSFTVSSHNIAWWIVTMLFRDEACEVVMSVHFLLCFPRQFFFSSQGRNVYYLSYYVQIFLSNSIFKNSAISFKVLFCPRGKYLFRITKQCRKRVRQYRLFHF